LPTKASRYLIPTTEPPEPNGNGNGHNHSLSYAKRAELWRQFTAHLIGLATVIWWMVYKEAPPK
jgi:hypothetical protein